MFEDPLPGLEREVESVVKRVTLFQLVHYPQALQVVLKAPEVSHAAIQGVLTRMPKWGVPQIMGQRDSFYQVFVDLQRTRNRPPELRDLQRMGQPGPKKISLVVQEDLCLVDKPTKCCGMDDAVAVALVVSSGWRW